MRKYEHIINDYLLWYVEKTGDENFLTENYLSKNNTDKENDIKRGTIWKEIINLCYKETEGIYWFTRFILGDLTYAGYPNIIRFNNLWWQWAKLAKEGDHIAIKCSRQHGKSTFWTVIQSVYRTALFEHYNVLIESASEDQAVMLMSFIVRIIENNEFLAEKKSKSAKWSTTEINYNGGKIVGKGVGSEVRGGTYDYIICDDILRSDNKLSDEDIDKFVDEELEPMIFVRRGQIVIVGTPKSESDIFSTIEEKLDLYGEECGWKMFTYPAILDEEKKILLCPDRFTWEQIMAKKQIMGRLKFEKEFLCRTYASGAQLFPYELRKLCMDKGTIHRMYSRYKPAELSAITYYMGIDCARAGTAGADYTVVTVIAFDARTQEKRIVWIWRKKGLKISEQVQQIAEISQNFNHPTILVEKNNIGQDFIDMMVDNFNLNVEEFLTSKGTKFQDLIRFLINAFENEKIIMPMADEYSRSQMKLLNKELDRFVIEVTRAGNEVYKGSGRSHDDMVMSLALANRCSQSYGYIPFAQALPSKNTTPLERFAHTKDMYEILKW